MGIAETFDRSSPLGRTPSAIETRPERVWKKVGILRLAPQPLVHKGCRDTPVRREPPTHGSEVHSAERRE